MAKKVDTDPTDQKKTKEQLNRALAVVRSEMANLSRKLTNRKTEKSNLSIGETELWLRSLIDQAPGSLAMFDRQMRYLSVSRRWLSEFKLGERDLIGLSHYDVFPEIPENWKSIHRRVLDGEVIRAEDERFERADGSVQYLRWEVRPWHVSPDEVGGIIIYTEDITERKQADEEIKQSRDRMKWVLEQVGIGTWFNELPFGHLNWDNQTRDLFFVPPVAEPTIELFWSHLHVDDHEPTRIAVEEAIRNRTTYSIEHRAINPKTGEVRWIRSIGRATYSEDGTPTRFDGINFDITKHKQAEEALRAKERQYRRIIETSNEGIWVIDHDNNTSFVNAKMAEMLACTHEEMLSASLFDFVDSEETAVAQNYIERRRHGITEQHDFKFRRKDGSCFWALLSTNPIHDDSGRYLGALAMVTDITPRKQAEEKLLKLNESLDRQVIERTALADARSKQLQTLAVELIEAEEKERRRIADLLHEDFQQLLAAARFKLQTGVHSAADLREIELLLEESILKSRDLSQELSPPVLQHSGIIAAIQALLVRMEKHFGLKIQLDIEHEVKIENATLNIFLYRAVREFLFNIVKHAGVKSGRVVLSRSNGSMKITASDRGKGFDPAILDRSRDKFGLGLITIRERASHIGGDLVIESAPGNGSRFTLTVPISPSPAKTQTIIEGNQQKFSVTKEIAESFGAIRVLFVDDHKMMRQGLIKMVSNKPGVQVIGEAANGLEALERARQLRPDVIVMDVSMPEMDGIEATRHIKAELPDVRVIGLSMHEDERISLDMREAGAEAFLRKTTSSSKLLKAIYGTARDEQETIPTSDPLS